MRKVLGIVVASVFLSVCLFGCESPPSAKPAAAGAAAPGGGTAAKGGATPVAGAEPSANPNYTGGVGGKAK